ncbi:lipocalin family protein [Portibacter lacus]|uniref:Lipocalin-like domain-containing protein n=1 Tax=Portibacter lacus TaxID=1099794 RepID=A0AA37SSA7_9BACT|nr:lipocalin family protein [Portibacter lacus]GLR18744.1 hypothetical protein GCM10007940_33600 [Portibacter lacus]
MYKLKFKMWTLLAVLFAGTFTITSCTKEKAAPTVSLSDTTFTGKIGETASTTLSAVTDGEYKELRITKYLGTDVDDSYGTNGTMTVSSALPYDFTYVLNEEGAETPVRFQFTVVDQEDQTGDANFVITTDITLAYVLVKFDWRLNSKLGKLFAESEPESEQIIDCEKDNVFTFNADGTMSLDFGELTGSGGGTCDFDGLSVYSTYEISNDESTLSMSFYNAFDPGDITTEVYTIKDYSLTDLVTTTPIDLSAFGGIEYDWTYAFKAQAK